MKNLVLFLVGLLSTAQASSAPTPSNVQTPENESLAGELDTDEDIELEEEADELDD